MIKVLQFILKFVDKLILLFSHVKYGISSISIFKNFLAGIEKLSLFKGIF